MMYYNGVRGALAADDGLSDLGAECKFRVQQTPEWKVHAVHIEAEMRKVLGANACKSCRHRETARSLLFPQQNGFAETAFH
jgi:hypothetical protein